MPVRVLVISKPNNNKYLYGYRQRKENPHTLMMHRKRKPCTPKIYRKRETLSH